MPARGQSACLARLGAGLVRRAGLAAVFAGPRPRLRVLLPRRLAALAPRSAHPFASFRPVPASALRAAGRGQRIRKISFAIRNRALLEEYRIALRSRAAAALARTGKWRARFVTESRAAALCAWPAMALPAASELLRPFPSSPRGGSAVPRSCTTLWLRQGARLFLRSRRVPRPPSRREYAGKVPIASPRDRGHSSLCEFSPVSDANLPCPLHCISGFVLVQRGVAFAGGSR